MRAILLHLSVLGACFFVTHGQNASQMEWDSRNISDSEFSCEGNVSIQFTSVPDILCGTEVLYGDGNADVPPVITYTDAVPNLFYTVIIVDRDARSPMSPTLSPIIHYVGTNITGSQLMAGFNISSAIDVSPFFAYSPPNPPSDGGCHRYYVMLYAQSNELTPMVDLTVTDRLNWNFPVWAATQNLSKLAVNYFVTKNPASDSECTAPTTTPTPTPAPACPAPPKEICCTRVLAGSTTSITVQLPFQAALSSIALWVGSPAGATPLEGLSLSIGSHDSMTGCAVVDRPPPPNATAMPGFDSMAVVCGSAGRVLRVVVPSAVRHTAPAPPMARGPVTIKTCVVNVTMPDSNGPPGDATIYFRL